MLTVDELGRRRRTVATICQQGLGCLVLTTAVSLAVKVQIWVSVSFQNQHLKVWIPRMAQMVVMVISSEFWVSRLLNESALWCRGLVHVPSTHCCRNIVHMFRTSQLWCRSLVRVFWMSQLWCRSHAHEFWTSQRSTPYAEAVYMCAEWISKAHTLYAEALYVCLEWVNKAYKPCAEALYVSLEQVNKAHRPCAEAWILNKWTKHTDPVQKCLSWTNAQSTRTLCRSPVHVSWMSKQVNTFCRTSTAACWTTTSREPQHLCSTSATTGRSFLPFSSEGTTPERSKRRPFFLFSWAVFPPAVKHRCC